MKVIGVTGGIACGKSTFTHYLKSKGHQVLDADEIVAKLFEDVEVQNKIMSTVGTLDRKKIRKIVFQSPVMRQNLEGILHPGVISVIESEINKHRANPKAPLFVSIPLLFEKDLSSMFDMVVAIVCEDEVQIQRLTQRDHIDELLARHMIHSQLSNKEKAEMADVVINNDGSLEDFHESIENFLTRFQK